jgi:hypothetical protein
MYNTANCREILWSDILMDCPQRWKIRHLFDRSIFKSLKVLFSKHWPDLLTTMIDSIKYYLWKLYIGKRSTLDWWRAMTGCIKLLLYINSLSKNVLISNLFFLIVNFLFSLKLYIIILLPVQSIEKEKICFQFVRPQMLHYSMHDLWVFEHVFLLSIFQDQLNWLNYKKLNSKQKMSATDAL